MMKYLEQIARIHCIPVILYLSLDHIVEHFDSLFASHAILCRSLHDATRKVDHLESNEYLNHHLFHQLLTFTSDKQTIWPLLLMAPFLLSHFVILSFYIILSIMATLMSFCLIFVLLPFRFFINRDPKYFGHVLCFLREGKIRDIEKVNLQHLIEEFSFFKIPFPPQLVPAPSTQQASPNASAPPPTPIPSPKMYPSSSHSCYLLFFDTYPFPLSLNPS